VDQNLKPNIIFDLDGTLVDSNAVCVAILQEMLVERGGTRVIDPRTAAQHMSLGGERMVRALLDECCLDPADDLADFRTRYAQRLTPADSLFPGVAAGLHRLREANFRLAICSNKPTNLCAKVLDDTGLAPMFDAVVGGQPGLRPKPAPDLLDAVLTALGATSRECLFVGDSDLDFHVADTAGMPFCFMTYGYAEPGWVPPAGAMFDRFDHLVAMLMAARQAG
jgi:phosphoglycolate phosphatase